MSDHDLPQYFPSQDIRHVKRFWIYVVGGSSRDWAKDLRFGIAGHTGADVDNSGGTRISSVGGAEKLLTEFLEAPNPEVSRGSARTPLDFPIQQKCFVMLKLYGDFWEFSRRSAGAVRTKDDLDRRYYRLRRLEVEGRGVCVCFCADEPEHSSQDVRHGINLYVDFLQRQGNDMLRLPVMIDPDIENKGGHP